MIPTNAAEIPAQAGAGEQKPLVEQESVSGAPEGKPEGLVSPPPAAPVASHSIVSREEKVEYRDQDGNILDPEAVKSLEGKVSFKTRYETRTRMVDAQGNEINPPEEDAVGVAPPHPDVEGSDPQTVGKAEPDVQEKPVAQRNVQADESKEQSIEKSDDGAAKPASEGNEATAA